MQDKILSLKLSFDEDLKKVANLNQLESLKVKYLGRKSPIQSLMQDLRTCSKEERPELGKKINELKNTITISIQTCQKPLEESELLNRLSQEQIDITLPGKMHFSGNKHPLSQMLDEALDILIGMGFSVQYTAEIETEYYNYDGLNYPLDHPARDMQDTFYIDEKNLLRSHTTTIQQHIMEHETPPIRVISSGKCYRNETITSRSHVFFHQLDALYIDTHVTFADLLATKKEFYMKLFNRKIELRVRPSYFPFVEPGMEIDIHCTACSGKGCSLCKQTGWLEVCGAGMVHPQVLEEGGLDPEKYSGYAWGLGIERLFMLRHGISDIRLFTENDTRFLAQFPG